MPQQPPATRTLLCVGESSLSLTLVSLDVQSFLQQFRPDLANANYDFVDMYIDGGVNNQSVPAGLEENLDIQVHRLPP
jgi:hypothetical protein